ncbi:MAG: hypothetical protein ACE5DY_09540 [Mariprofundaceae bacterium]
MELPDWIGQVIVAGGGGAAIAFGLFKFFGQNWLKHQLAKDLEMAKSEISFHAAKRRKLYDKEYEVFPEIWARLSDAKATLQAALMEFRTMPDFNRISGEDFMKWLESTDLEDEEKEEMVASTDRMFLFNRILDYRSLRRAEESFFEFQTYLQKNRIFLSPDIREKFDEIKNLLRKAWAARKTDVRLDGQTGSVDFLTKALDIFNDEVEPLMGELEDIIQGKLFPEREATK